MHSEATSDTSTFDLALSFRAKNPGRYGANVILRSRSNSNDIRLVRIECLVIPEASSAEFDFECPACESITQLIPIINETTDNWNLRVRPAPSRPVSSVRTRTVQYSSLAN